MTDLIIIGSGPGGYRAAEHAAKHGLHVTIIERAQAGGTCLNSGCIPTKALCRTAEVLNTIREADAFGISAETPSLDFSKAMQRKDDVVSQLRSGVESLMQMPGITMLRGNATFLNENTVRVDSLDSNDSIEKIDSTDSTDSTEKINSNEKTAYLEISARNIIIATGSVPKRLPIPGMSLPGILDSTAILNLKEKPESLAIIGAGVIGMEMAAVMNSFGVKVMVIEFLKECLPVLDADIAKRLRQSISKQGVEFFMQSACKEIREKDGLLEVLFERKGKEESIVAEKVLVATGRAPQIDSLNLEAAGIEVGRGGITVNDRFQTNIPHIYAIGDVNGKCMLAHAATMQGIDVVNQILNTSATPADTLSHDIMPSALSPIRHDIMPSAIFTHPEAASVGLTEDQAKELLGTKPLVKKAMYRSNGKALAMNETEGLLKLICQPDDGKILGCHIYGAHAADMAQEVCVLMNQDATLRTLAAIIHIHPTLGEMVWDAAL